jgi:hypothetical protein
VRELFIQFRNIYRSAIKDMENNSFVKKSSEHKENLEGKEEVKKSPNRVGVEENTFGFGAGKAVIDSKPTRNITGLVNIPKDEFDEDDEEV